MSIFWCALQVLFVASLISVSTETDDEVKSSPKSSSTSSLVSYKNAADHWIAYPRSPYAAKLSTQRPLSSTSTKIPTTSPDQSRNLKYKNKKRRQKFDYENYDSEVEPNFSPHPEASYIDFPKYTNDEEPDDEYDDDYDERYYRPKYRSRKKIFMSESSPPSLKSASPSSDYHSPVANIFTPKIAQFVVHNPKKYTVRRIQPQAIFTVKPTHEKDLYHSGSSPVGRRFDLPEYDDKDEGYSGFGPQNSFPPKQVMDKITSPGDQKPCHGPECHQHHKGLVRFYWKRVIYPNDEYGNRIRPSRGRGRGRGRRRYRDRIRSPSSQREYYAPGDEKRRPIRDEEPDDKGDDDDDEDQDETELNAKRHDLWLPGRAYGHDFDEGANYSKNEKRIYRDKRFAYKKYRQQTKY